VRDIDEPLPLGRKQQRAVLALLLVHLNRLVSSDALVEALWPEDPPGRPLTAIQGYISGLRKLLGRETIETAAGGYVLRAKPQQLDRDRFEELLAEGRDELARSQPEKAAEALSAAQALWRGDALADFTY